MVKITDRDFSVEEVIDRMNTPKVGGIVTYLGTVRSLSQGREVEGIEFDADEAAIGKIGELDRKVRGDFDVEEVAIIHRVGQLKVGDKLLLIAVSASHRQPAFDACMSIIDGVKVIHSAWAREYYKEN